MDLLAAVRRMLDEWTTELLERLAAVIAAAIAEHEAREHRSG